MAIILPAIILVYCYSLYITGRAIVRRWFDVYPESLFRIVSSLLAGLLVVVPITYLFSCILSFTDDGMLWGVISYCVVSIPLLWKDVKLRGEKYPFFLSDAVLTVCSAGFGIWMMWKAFHAGGDGTWYVARNAVFDTAHALSIIRSFSWGNNLPFSSLFANGFQEMYHFFFYFLVACLERFGIQLVFALNAASSIVFALYLIVGYYAVRILCGGKRFLGWLTMLFLVTHSTLTWLFAVMEGSIRTLQDVWRLPNYLYAGPFDQSVISLFFTLNVFINQRHLAIGIAASLWLYIIIVLLLKRKNLPIMSIVVLGVCTGLLSLWNTIFCFLVMFVIAFVCILHNKWKYVWYYLASSVIIMVICILPFLSNMFLSVAAISSSGQAAVFQPGVTLWSQIRYWVYNLGIGIIPFFIGYATLKPELRKNLMPLLFLFPPLVCFTALGTIEFAQKLLNIWNVVFVSLSALGVVWLWQKRGYLRYIAVLCVFGMTASGLIDLMVIKNDFAYPAVTPKMQIVINEIRAHTSKKTVVLSHQEMFHPVALAGRKQYYGFFSPPEAKSREDIVKNLFEQSDASLLLAQLKELKISHVVLPKTPDTDVYQTALSTIYEDEQNILLSSP